MKRVIMRIAILMFILLVLNCATTPIYRIWQPWQRTLTADVELDVNSTIKTTVICKSSPFLGSDKLLNTEIKKRLDSQLRRRGFKIQNEDADIELILIYRTERIDKLSYSSFNYSSQNISLANYAFSGIGSSYSLGVSVAKAVGYQYSKTVNINEQKLDQYLSFNHNISIEIRNVSESLIWKGESYWDSGNIDLLNDISFILRLTLSNLPYDSQLRQMIPEIKAVNEENYYMMNCQKYWYSCPALPYRINFEKAAFNTWFERYEIPEHIKNHNALALYVDLISNAEFAVPLGDNNWWQPVRQSLWKKAIIGGKYYLGHPNKPANILIKLDGTKEGYIVGKAWIANDQEYLEYENKLKKWKKALTEYYDFYEKPNREKVINASENKKVFTKEMVAEKEYKYYYDTKTNLLHNETCKWYGKLKSGVFRNAPNGNNCELCGGSKEP